MIATQLAARSAIEALRSGVPSPHAVEQLGTTQDEIREVFEARFHSMLNDEPVDPLVLSASFGSGKTHLLNYLSAIASKKGAVTGIVVVSPEMPLGNPHIVLKALATSSSAPGYEGRALRELAIKMRTNSTSWAAVRLWARENKLHDRVAACLHAFEEAGADDELRMHLVGEFEGNPIQLPELRAKLKEIGQTTNYDLRGSANNKIAHDRLAVLPQLFRTCGTSGWVVLFDECERICRFAKGARLKCWAELGWWQRAAQKSGARLLPVFAFASGTIEEAIKTDESILSVRSGNLIHDDFNAMGRDGLEMIKRPMRLTPPTQDQEARIAARVREIYSLAYPDSSITSTPHRVDISTTIRSEVRRWITQWDLMRHYPDYRPTIVEEKIATDLSEFEAEIMPTENPEDD
ncbi:MAG: BREX system ATP-binding domain-containing protein [Chthonomonadales bacterium]